MLFFAPLPVRFPVGPKSRCHHNLLTCFVRLVHSWTASLGAASAPSPACPSSCYLPEANQYARPGPNSHLFTSDSEHCFFPLLGSAISPTSFPLDLTLISSLFLSLSQWITSWGSDCALKLAHHCCSLWRVSQCCFPVLSVLAFVEIKLWVVHSSASAKLAPWQNSTALNNPKTLGFKSNIRPFSQIEHNIIAE